MPMGATEKMKKKKKIMDLRAKTVEWTSLHMVVSLVDRLFAQRNEIKAIFLNDVVYTDASISFIFSLFRNILHENYLEIIHPILNRHRKRFKII